MNRDEKSRAVWLMFVVLLGSTAYAADELPPPEDVSMVKLDATHVKFTWSNPTINDQIIVKRNGSQVALLAGDATEYTDTLAGPATSPVQYEIIGKAGAFESAPATVRFLPWEDECLPFNGTGGSGRASRIWFPLITGRVEELQMCFHLEEDAPALLFQVFSVKTKLPGQLKCRVRDFDPPHDVLGPAYDGIGVEDFEQFRENYTEAVLPAPLSAGDYIVGFYSDGVAANQWSYELQLDGDPENPGEPCPPPFYPMLKITPLCDNIPPTVLDIVAETPVLNDAFDLDRLPYGMAPADELGFNIRADAVDFDGAVVDYGWVFSFACDRLNEAESEAQCLVRCRDNGDCLEAANSDGNVIFYHFPYIGNWTVGVNVTDNSGWSAFASETLYIDVLDVQPPCGGPPTIYAKLDPDVEGEFYELNYIPDINESLGPVNVEFTVKATPSGCADIESIEMEMVDPINGAVYAPLSPASLVAGSEDAQGGVRYKATFNMSDLGYRDRVLMRATATDDDGLESTREWTIHLCPLPLIFDSDHNNVDFVGTTLEYDGGANRYDLSARLPEAPVLDLPIELDALGIRLENVVDAYLKFEEYLDDEFWHPQSLQGRLRATLLSYDLFDKDFEVSLDGPVAYGCDDYEIQYLLPDPVSIYSEDWSWEVFDTTLWEGFVGPVHVRVRGSLDVGMGIDVDLEEVRLVVRAVEEAGEPVVEIGVEIVPAIEAWAEGEIRVEVFFGLASASVLLRPTIGIELPIELQSAIPPLALNVTVDECFRLKLEVKVRACVDLPFVGSECLSSGWLDIFDESFPDGCSGRAVTERAAAGVADEPSPLKYPTIAVSPNGQKAMAMLIDDRDPDPLSYKPELYYSVDAGAGFPAPVPVVAAGDNFTQRDVNVVFTSNTQALAVWTQGRLTHAQVAALPQDTNGANTGFKNTDVFYALWNELGGWGAAQMLTNDAVPNPLIPDGRPTAAAVPGANAAWVAWVRSENENMFSGVGDANVRGMAVFARKITGGVPGPMFKITTDDAANPAADIQPALAVSPSGAVALLAWVRDSDGDFDTSADRRLMYSVNFGAAWTAPAAMTDPLQLPGVLMPSAALSSNDDGMVAFTVREVNTNGQIAGEGNKDLVYSIEIENTVFQAPMPLKRGAEKRNGREFDGVYGRDPVVRYLDTTHAALVFRSFDGFGRSGGDGEVGVSTIDLAQATPRWSFARDFTDDEYRDWDIAAAVASGNVIRTVRDSQSGPPAFRGMVFDNIAVAPNVVADRIRISNPHAPAGSTVTATVVVKNDGLAAPMQTAPTVLRFGEVVNNVFVERFATPFNFTAPPDQSQTFSYPFTMPARTSRWRGLVEPIQGETDPTDNVRDVVVGVLPPLNVICANAPGGIRPRVALRWENGEIYQAILVYRDGRLMAELDGDIESYVDAAASPGDHVWAVSGKIGLGISAADEAECGLTVTLPGDWDADGDVDLDDAVQLGDPCLAGPDVPYPAGCGPFDFDGDGDVDLEDVAAFARAFTG